MALSRSAPYARTSIDGEVVLVTFLLAITDFSTGEGVYTADMVAALAPRLGYDSIAGWDTKPTMFSTPTAFRGSWMAKSIPSSGP